MIIHIIIITNYNNYWWIKQATSEDKKRTTDGQVLKMNQTNLWRQKSWNTKDNYWRRKETTDEETTDELVQGQTRQLPKNKFRSTEELTTDYSSEVSIGHQKLQRTEEQLLTIYSSEVYQNIRSFIFSAVSFISCCLYKAAVDSILVFCFPLGIC